IACMLAGAYSLVSYAEERLGVRLGQTTADGMFALEDAECLAGCDQAVCVQVNHRFFGPIDEQAFDELIDDLRTGRLDETVPPHGVLCRVERTVGLEAHGPVPISTRAQGRLSTAAGTTAGTTARARTDAPPTDAPTSEPPPTDAPPSQTPTSEASGAAHEDVPGAEIAGGNAGSRDQAPGEDRS
ncbi:MAG: NAD(P)H-dependent oxidoreductase subunit E, partial [Acidimicrobiales bacterium]